MEAHTLTKIKKAIRISHNALDDDITSDIEGCLADLKAARIIDPQDTDPLIFNAIKLWCKSLYTDDTAKAAEYLRRYESLRGSLQMAEGYGWKDEEADTDE